MGGLGSLLVLWRSPPHRRSSLQFKLLRPRFPSPPLWPCPSRHSREQRRTPMHLLQVTLRVFDCVWGCVSMYVSVCTLLLCASRSVGVSFGCRYLF